MIKKLIFAFLFLTSFSSLKAQNSEISFEIGATRSCYRATKGDYYSILKDVTPLNALSLASHYSYNFKNNWVFSTGLIFVNKGQESKAIYTDHTGTPLGKKDAYFYMDYFEVPILLGYKFDSENYCLIPKCGFTLGYNFYQKTHDYFNTDIIDYSEWFNNIEQAKQFEMSLSASLDYRYKLSKDLQLKFEPKFSYSLSKFSVWDINGLGYLKHYYFGANIGLVMSL